ncbi:olfactory receptor 14C36-like [Sceloporus undulatus]|uniref:olfactory receptor 14C36-like n=1 Tax=Sceloporus undulatus TaxID=8520 RepID=UPI001C4B9DC2|nr:olfactory receptor 14C36-like [Sceloporus undulatus]
MLIVRTVLLLPFTGNIHMEEQRPLNKSSLSVFLLLDFSEVWEVQILHFVGFLVFYMATAAGNLLIIAAIASDHHLHTPMYFFLMDLAIHDVGQVSVIFPSAMANILTNSRHISYSGCVAQVLFYIFFLSTDFFLLTVMAYDRYVAICNPLHYAMVMNVEACLRIVTAILVMSFLYGALHTVGTFAAPFCSNIVNQFFCEIPQLLKLTCSDLYLVEIGAVLLSGLLGLGCCIFIIITYVHIFMTVMKIPSLQGRQKAFSTCLPHLIVFSMFAFTAFTAYLKLTSDAPLPLSLALTLIYSMVPPLMNPIVYAMRNKEIKNALSKLLVYTYSSRHSLIQHR